MAVDEVHLLVLWKVSYQHCPVFPVKEPPVKPVNALRHRSIAQWRHFTGTSRILQFVVFLCKLGLILLTLSGIDKFKLESKNEINSGSCSEMSSAWKWPIKAGPRKKYYAWKYDVTLDSNFHANACCLFCDELMVKKRMRQIFHVRLTGD